jgi:hypothetical protein
VKHRAGRGPRRLLACPGRAIPPPQSAGSLGVGVPAHRLDILKVPLNRSSAWSAVLRNTRFCGLEEMMSAGSDMSEARPVHSSPDSHLWTFCTPPRLHAAESPAPSAAPRPPSQPAPRPDRAEEPLPPRSSPVSSQRARAQSGPVFRPEDVLGSEPPCPARVHYRTQGSPSRVPPAMPWTRPSLRGGRREGFLPPVRSGL